MRAAPAAVGAASGSRTRTSWCGCSARTGLPITTASAPSGGKIAEEAEGPREAGGRASRAARKRLPSGARSRGADEGVAARPIDRLEKLRAATAATALIQARAKARHRAPFRQAQGPEPAEGELAACEASQRARGAAKDDGQTAARTRTQAAARRPAGEGPIPLHRPRKPRDEPGGARQPKGRSLCPQGSAGGRWQHRGRLPAN